MSELLAINLAHNISTDQKSIEETRRTDGEIVQRKMDGEAPDYTQDFQFELLAGDQQGPDIRTSRNDC